MDLGLVGLVDKIEERFGRTAVTILLFLLYLLVVSLLLQVIIHAWVAISDLIERGGRAGTAVSFGVILLNLLVWWIGMGTIRKNTVERVKRELLEWNAEGRPPQEGSEKSSEAPSRFTRIRDIAILVGVAIGFSLLVHLWLYVHEWALAIIRRRVSAPLMQPPWNPGGLSPPGRCGIWPSSFPRMPHRPHGRGEELLTWLG